MEQDLKLFEKIWLDYHNILPVNIIKYDKYYRIINKIRKNDFDFSICKNDFIDLIEIISFIIYNYNYTDEYDKDYDENNNYENDKELNCCYNIKTYIKTIL